MGQGGWLELGQRVAHQRTLLCLSRLRFTHLHGLDRERHPQSADRDNQNGKESLRARGRLALLRTQFRCAALAFDALLLAPLKLGRGVDRLVFSAPCKHHCSPLITRFTAGLAVPVVLRTPLGS